VYTSSDFSTLASSLKLIKKRASKSRNFCSHSCRGNMQLRNAQHRFRNVVKHWMYCSFRSCVFPWLRTVANLVLLTMLKTNDSTSTGRMWSTWIKLQQQIGDSKHVGTFPCVMHELDDWVRSVLAEPEPIHAQSKLKPVTCLHARSPHRTWPRNRRFEDGHTCTFGTYSSRLPSRLGTFFSGDSKPHRVLESRQATAKYKII
jgi:hypothetical protein